VQSALVQQLAAAMQAPLHALPPFATCVQAPRLHPSTVHGSVSAQLSAVCVQPVAVLHASVVHALLSLQLTAACVQPVAVLHASVVHALLSSQLTAVCVHVPLLHASVVHALLSLQSTAVCVQAPLASQPSVVHASPSSHATVWLHVMKPSHASVVHALPSLVHGVPAALLKMPILTHVPSQMIAATGPLPRPAACFCGCRVPPWQSNFSV
jgi:hypothetical protein